MIIPAWPGPGWKDGDAAN